jgi:hypothetical protein
MSRDATRRQMSNGKIAGAVRSLAMPDVAGCRRMNGAPCDKKSIEPAAIFIRDAVKIENKKMPACAAQRTGDENHRFFIVR